MLTQFFHHAAGFIIDKELCGTDKSLCNLIYIPVTLALKGLPVM